MSDKKSELNPCAHRKNPCGELPNSSITGVKKLREVIDRQEAIALLAKFKNMLPKATTLVDMKTNNVFAEPGT